MTAYKAPCQHGAYDPHAWTHERTGETTICPGGTLLPPGSLVIPLEAIPDGGGSDYVGLFWPKWACDALEEILRIKGGFLHSEEILDALAAAQEGRET